MDLKTFHQKALNIVADNKLSKLFVGIDVTWMLQTVHANELVCACQIVAVSVRNQYIAVKEATPEAALSVFKSKIEEWAESKSVASTMLFNQKQAQA